MSLASNVTGRKVVDRLPVELYEQLIFNFIATQSLDTINDSITKLCIIEPSLKAKWPALKNQWRAQIVEFFVRRPHPSESKSHQQVTNARSPHLATCPSVLQSCPDPAPRTAAKA